MERRGVNQGGYSKMRIRELLYQSKEQEELDGYPGIQPPGVG
jgi:hypothetical protein